MLGVNCALDFRGVLADARFGGDKARRQILRRGHEVPEADSQAIGLKYSRPITPLPDNCPCSIFPRIYLPDSVLHFKLNIEMFPVKI